MVIMISRHYRFHGLNALRFVHRQGKTVRAEACNLRYTLNPQRNACRMAVVVSKKVSKSAVVRNRIRRRIYEAAREQLSVTVPYDLVFTAQGLRLATMPKKELNKIISRLLQVSGMTNPEGGGAVDNSSKNPEKAYN